jgi:hypothetical protein
MSNKCLQSYCLIWNKYLHFETPCNLNYEAFRIMWGHGARGYGKRGLCSVKIGGINQTQTEKFSNPLP